MLEGREKEMCILNHFISICLNGTIDKNKENKVREVASFLTDFVLPSLISDFTNFVSTPVDGQTLTTVMHSRGISINKTITKKKSAALHTMTKKI